MKFFQSLPIKWLRRPAATNLPIPRKWLGHHAPGRCGSILLPLLFISQLHAAEPADPTIKLREQLRAITLQLRTAQTEAANAQAAQAATQNANDTLAAKITTLEKRVETLNKETATTKLANEQTLATLQAKLADRDKRLALLNEALDKWKDGYQKAAAVARTKEDERAQLAAEIITLKHTIADRETKNIALFNTANEILDRYQNYSLGKALAAREPFVSTTRVKVENQVQGYKDKILDNRIEAKATKP
jgi:chromosome segregation ATPase